MTYLGPQTNLDTFQSNGYEIVVMQQHCGGQNLIVYKNSVQQNGLNSYQRFYFYIKNIFFQKNLHLNLDVIMIIHLH
jgi:hypothetical protein